MKERKHANLAMKVKGTLHLFHVLICCIIILWCVNKRIHIIYGVQFPAPTFSRHVLNCDGLGSLRLWNQ